jgi:hypothetical protein
MGRKVGGGRRPASNHSNEPPRSLTVEARAQDSTWTWHHLSEPGAPASRGLTASGEIASSTGLKHRTFECGRASPSARRAGRSGRQTAYGRWWRTNAPSQRSASSSRCGSAASDAVRIGWLRLAGRRLNTLEGSPLRAALDAYDAGDPDRCSHSLDPEDRVAFERDERRIVCPAFPSNVADATRPSEVSRRGRASRGPQAHARLFCAASGGGSRRQAGAVADCQHTRRSRQARRPHLPAPLAPRRQRQKS